MTRALALAKRLHRLERLEDARGLYFEYSRRIEQLDAAGVAALFLPAARLVTPRGELDGASSIKDFFQQSFAADPAPKRHFVVNHKIISFDAATVRIECDFLFTAHGDCGATLGWGRYDDLIDLRSPRPRFAAKTIAVDAKTDLAERPTAKN